MKVRSILELSEEEIQTIMSCGQLLKEIKTGLDNHTFSEVTSDTTSLVQAIREIADKVLIAITPENASESEPEESIK